MSFYALQVSFDQVSCAFTEIPVKLFGTTLKEMTFALAEKRLEHLEIIKLLCVHRPKS